MPEEIRLRMRLSRVRQGESVVIHGYYTLGRKPAGGLVARVEVPEDLDLKTHDTLVFDFTLDKP